MRSSSRPSVCLSVRPSVTRVYCDKTNESSADILTPYEKEIYLVFLHEERLVGDVPFYLKFWGQTEPLCYLTVIFRPVRSSSRCVLCAGSLVAEAAVPNSRELELRPDLAAYCA